MAAKTIFSAVGASVARVTSSSSLRSADAGLPDPSDVDEAVAVPLYDQVDSYATSKKLKGFTARADELMYLYGPSIEG